MKTKYQQRKRALRRLSYLIGSVAIVFCLASAVLLATVPAGATNLLTEVVHVDFDSDTPGQPPMTMGPPYQPSFMSSPAGTSIFVQASANGIATQPVVLTNQVAGDWSGVGTPIHPIFEGVVRIEATVAFDRLADGGFLLTSADTGADVTWLIMTASGEIQDYTTRTPVGTYAPNKPFRVRMDIDMSAKTWSVAVDNEMNGFDDDPMTTNLPFVNPKVTVAVNVVDIYASLSLFPTLSVAPTSVAYDDIQVWVSTVLTFPVYRFSLKSSPAKFYTIYESEKDWVVQNLSSEYSLDGVAFYAYQEQ